MYDASPPPPRRRSTGTIVIAVVLILAMVLTGVGLAAWAVTSLFSGRSGGEGSIAPPPPEPSVDAEPPSYPSELKRFYEQSLDWRRCGEHECTRLTVPLDYAEPEGREIALAVLRSPAERRDQRVGQLVVNPGGPGGSGVQYAASGSLSFGRTLTRYFDIVGFDPRGVARSTPLRCADTEELDELISSDPDPDDPGELRRVDRLNREFGQGCLDNNAALAAHVSTHEAARDIDVLRSALGEVQLDYFGASYGTLLGATYADLFPGNVRRMVLDGAIDPSLNVTERALGQAGGFEVALRAYLGNCVESEKCFLGDSVDEAAGRVGDLLERLDERPLPTSGDRRLTEGLALYGIFLPLYVESYWPLLTAALKQAFDGSGDGLLQLADQYNKRGPEGYTDNSTSALYAVNCLDHDDAVPSSEVAESLPKFEKVSPTFGRIFAYGTSACASWPVKGVEPTDLMNAEGAPPIVVVGTTRDPATPYEQSVALAEQLDSGVLVTRDGDGHTGFQQGNECVDEAIEAYLLAGTAPEDGLSC